MSILLPIYEDKDPLGEKHLLSVLHIAFAISSEDPALGRKCRDLLTQYLALSNDLTEDFINNNILNGFDDTVESRSKALAALIRDGIIDEG